MEFDIFHLNRFPPCRPACRLEHDLVVQTQPQLRHARQVAFHLYSAEDFRAEDIAA